MPIYRPGPQFYTSSPLGGSRVHKPVGSGVDWSQWFDHFWQAKGAGSYAVSLLDLVGAQNLVEGNGAVPWAAGTGWGFVAANAQWLDTGLIAANDQSWSMLLQFANLLGTNHVIGSVSAGIGGIIYQPSSGGLLVSYRNGNGVINVVPRLLVGNLGVAGPAGYRNGIQEGGVLPAWTGINLLSIYIGCVNGNGIASFFSTFDVIAVGIKKSPALTAPQVAAAALAMSLL